MVRFTSIPKLTPKEQEVLDFLKSFYQNHGYAPSLSEIASHFQKAVPTAQNYVRSLILKGAIARIPGKSRSIIFKTEKPENMTVSVPLLGTISAGEGITLYENDNPELIEAPSQMTTSGYAHYALKVIGFSMKDDGIIDGDIIIVRQQATAEVGDPIVAILKGRIDERATLKRFYPKGDVIELRPRNPSMRPIIVNRENLEVRGKFMGLVRKN